MAKSGISGRKAHVARLRKLASPQTTALIGKALYVGGDLVRTDAQISITQGSVSGRNHVPSVAPAPPNQDTGVLANNIENVLVSPEEVEVSSNAPYSAALEYGTSRMPARPFMRPALQANLKNIKQLVEKAKRAAMRQSRSSAKD